MVGGGRPFGKTMRVFPFLFFFICFLHGEVFFFIPLQICNIEVFLFNRFVMINIRVICINDYRIINTAHQKITDENWLIWETISKEKSHKKNYYFKNYFNFDLKSISIINLTALKKTKNDSNKEKIKTFLHTIILKNCGTCLIRVAVFHGGVSWREAWVFSPYPLKVKNVETRGLHWISINFFNFFFSFSFSCLFQFPWPKSLSLLRGQAHLQQAISPRPYQRNFARPTLVWLRLFFKLLFTQKYIKIIFF